MINASGETFSNRGTFDTSSGTLVLKNGQISREKLLQEDLSPIALSMLDARVHDLPSSGLSGAATGDDLGLISGVFGTDAPTIQSSDSQSATTTQYCRLLYPISSEYVFGETMTLRIRAGMVTTVADSAATVDVECYVVNGDGGVGSDICATVAQSINSLTKANLDFTVTPGALVQGDLLDVRVTIAITDAAGATAVIGELSSIKLLRDIKG